MKVLNFLFVVIVTTLLVGTLLFSEEDTWKGPGLEGVAWRNGRVGIGLTDPDPDIRLVVGGVLCPAIKLKSTDGSTGFIQTLHGNGGVRLYDGKDYTMHWKRGNVGIGTSDPRVKLDVKGNIFAQKINVAGDAYIKDKLTIANEESSRTITRLLVWGKIGAHEVWAKCGMLTCSDVRYKKNLNPIENALDRVIQLRGVSFSWKDESMGKGQQLGVIGQEVEKVFPEVVSTDSDGYKSVAYSQLVAPLIEAIKELKTENETLKVRIEALESKLKDY